MRDEEVLVEVAALTELEVAVVAGERSLSRVHSQVVHHIQVPAELLGAVRPQTGEGQAHSVLKTDHLVQFERLVSL